MSARAIETFLLGVHFRSQLEARWAWVFNELGWRWEYEPVVLDGYIPDFMLLFPAGPVLVEIKPKFSVDALEAAAAEKIDRSGWASDNLDDALILGATWNPDGEAGPLRQNPAWGHSPDWDDRADWGEGAWIVCRECRRLSIRQETHLWRCISCGAVGKVYTDEPNLDAAWREAGNAVRWRGRRAGRV